MHVIALGGWWPQTVTWSSQFHYLARSFPNWRYRLLYNPRLATVVYNLIQLEAGHAVPDQLDIGALT